MNPIFALIFNSILFGIALAMDAVSVSLANGLNEPKMKRRKMCGIAGMFAFFQALMPFIGWVLLQTICKFFAFFNNLVPWIALVLLCYIGGKMLYEGIKGCDDEDEKPGVGFIALVVQGIATSIDALSAGLDMQEYNLPEALISVAIISAVTFIICMGGLFIGRKSGTALADKAGILGGSILIFIGLEIFITSFI